MDETAGTVSWEARLRAVALGQMGALGAWRRVRDLSIIPIAPDVSLVLACDSVGGIGPKPHDTYPTDGYTLGRFAARVPLMELLACGATPLLIADLLTVEREPTGTAILVGVRDEAAQAGLTPDALTGSTEENVPTLATGVGITVLGLVAAAQFRPGRGRAGDLVVCVGVPKSAPDDIVRLDDADILDLAALRRLLACEAVGDVLPVGSRGLGAEADDLAAGAGLRFLSGPTPAYDLRRSGGPATCCLVTLPPSAFPMLRALPLPPLAVIGTLR